MADMHTPLPCPHCGGIASVNEPVPGDFFVECEMPDCRSSSCVHGSEAEAIEAWNRRAPSQDAETIKALRETLLVIEDMIDNCANIPRDPSSIAMMVLEYARAALAGSAS